MIINYKNTKNINDFYVHDSVFEGFTYDYAERIIHLRCNNNFSKNSFDFQFKNVIYFDMQSCMFWGSGPHILCAYVEEASAKYAYLKELAFKNDDNKCLDRGNKHILVGFEINSGDVLEIICECVEINQSVIDSNN